MTTLKSQTRFTSIDHQLASRIADEFGSPVYLMDETGLATRLREFQAAAKSVYQPSVIAVSYKTNPTRSLLADMHREGAYAEVVSGDEYEIALSLGVPPTEIIFNGPAKSDNDLKRAISLGSFIHCDHEDEVDRIAVIARDANIVAKVGLRLYFPAEESWERFGFWADLLDADCDAMVVAKRIVDSSHLKLSGFHAHIGTNIRELDKFHCFASVYAEFIEKIRSELKIELEWIDVGGGLAGIVPLLLEDRVAEHELPSLDEYCLQVAGPLLPCLNRFAQPPRLFFEPGRALFNATGGILVSVIGRRPADSDGIESVILNAGITSLAFAFKYDHPVHVCKGGDPVKKVRLLGPTCMNQDVVTRPVKLPELFPGDHLVLYGTGCYSMALASSFTHFRLGTVGWSEGDQLRWLRMPETIEHSRKLDVIPNME